MYERFQDERHNEWARLVKQRDGHHCQICGRVENLHAHHILNYAEHPNLRYELSNGVSWCSLCHESFHAIYGKSGNNKQQIKEFILFVRSIEKIAQQQHLESKK